MRTCPQQIAEVEKHVIEAFFRSTYKLSFAQVFEMARSAKNEKADDSKAVMGTLAVWYDTRLRDNQGRGWLRNLRTWWRAGGEQLALPVDGVTGATRPVGTHALHFAGATGALAGLPAGRYQLAVEVAREQGGRELLRVPFEWGGAANAAQAKGEKELGQVTVNVEP